MVVARRFELADNSGTSFRESFRCEWLGIAVDSGQYNHRKTDRFLATVTSFGKVAASTPQRKEKRKM